MCVGVCVLPRIMFLEAMKWGWRAGNEHKVPSCGVKSKGLGGREVWIPALSAATGSSDKTWRKEVAKDRVAQGKAHFPQGEHVER